MHRRRLALDEEEHRVTLEKDRLARAETRMATAEKEVTELRQELTRMTREHQTSTTEAFQAKDQLKTLNANLKNTSDALASRERECSAAQEESRALRTTLQTFKEDNDRNRQAQETLITNLRMQLEETREVIASLKDSKEREFRKLRA